MDSRIKAVAKKELSTYFSSPIAFIFLGTFLLVNMFVFFSVEKFFARNIVDVRPLFEWMPLLLVFLVAALTMKMWSEEQRMGTLEFLMTTPVKTSQLVFGKFLAGLALVAIALLLTIGVPATISFTGNLDWGPVIGAYLASLLLAAAYISVGLFVSSKTDNQIVSLIVTVVICYALYMLGSDAITGLFGNNTAEIFRLLGTGTRFESINRGMIDFRDLYYYLSIVGVFLTLNIYALEKLKWAKSTEKPAHSKYFKWVTLCVVNFLVANLWLYKIPFFRADLTEGNQYSISPATETILKQLREPLLIRGYFSSKTHPLLAPLVPQIRDLIAEYEVAGDGKVRSEFIDPVTNPELEQEANQKYNIKPVPFQISDRYQASLVNSYFDILISYGDKYEVLGFRDLIEIKAGGETEIDVQLRNLEYDLTKSIKKVLYGFNDTASMLDSFTEPVKFTAYFSSKSLLPEKLAEFSDIVQNYLNELQTKSGGKFAFQILDPGSADSNLGIELKEKYGFRPMVASLFDPKQFYFYMVIEQGDQPIAVPLPENFTKEGAQQTIDAALKRFSPGFLKTVGFVKPPAPQQNPMMMQMGMAQQGRQFGLLEQSLEENMNIQSVSLKDGKIPETVDLLLLAAPENLSELELFAVDQFLMKGGTVVLSTSPFGIKRERNGVSASKHMSGLEDWLSNYGITFGEELVLDKQNEAYPIPVRRSLGAFQVEEMKMIPYPFFPDIRGNAMNEDNGIVSGISQVTLNWASPLKVDEEKNKDRKYNWLLKSSKDSWVSKNTGIEPDFRTYPELGFEEPQEKDPSILAVSVEGSFDSYFTGKESPLLEAARAKQAAEAEKEAEKKDGAEPKKEDDNVIANIIERSPESARIIVYASNEFLVDQTLQLSGVGGSDRFRNSLQLVQNTIDWSLEDRALLSIRSRGKYSKTMLPMENSEKAFFEVLNYILIGVGLLLVFFVNRSLAIAQRQRYQQLLHV